MLTYNGNHWCEFYSGSGLGDRQRHEAGIGIGTVRPAVETVPLRQDVNKR